MNKEKYLPLTETMYYILLALTKPSHGYLIMQTIEELSKGTVKIAAGTLYGAIENLLKEKLIEPVSTEDNRRKSYIISSKGKMVLKQDCERMEYIVSITKNYI